MWTPAVPRGAHPLYLALADALAADVAAERLAPGERLPTHRALALRLGLNVGTVTRAYAEARRRGLVSGEVGRGTYVRARGAPLGDLVAAPDGEAAGPGVVDLAFNVPLEELAPPFGAALEELARAPDLARLFHGYRAAGLAPHREAGARWLARSGVAASAERTLVCGGAQHALAVAFATLASAGDVVATEPCTYPGMKGLAATLGLRLEPLAADEHGLVPESFERACRRHAPKALYCMPTLQNPTGTVLPLERRLALVAIARAHGVALVEDDTYAFLHDSPPPPLAALAPELAYYVVGTSKSIAAGLRVGLLLAPDDPRHGPLVVERLVASLAALTWMSAPLTAELATRWFEDGTAARLVAAKRAEIATRRRLFDAVLPDLATCSDPASCHVWATLPEPWRSEDFVARAERADVRISPSRVFVVGRGSAPHAVRLCIGTPPSREALEQALARLASLLERPGAERCAVV